MTKTPKFTKTERAKLQVVFDKLRAELNANLSPDGYSNGDGCCGNCGDVGGFYTLLYRLEQEVGMKHKYGGTEVLSKSVLPYYCARRPHSIEWGTWRQHT